VNSSRFSVIQYHSKTFRDVSVAQIIGIVSFNDTVQLIVSRLELEESQRIHRKLPYPLYKYGLEPKDKTRFTFEQVPICDVYGPCFSIPALDHVDHDMFSVGRHHSNKQNPSFFYVLTPDRTKLHDILEYSDYEKYNGMTHPWDKRGGDIVCFNAFQLLFK